VFNAVVVEFTSMATVCFVRVYFICSHHAPQLYAKIDFVVVVVIVVIVVSIVFIIVVCVVGGGCASGLFAVYI
jgi:hypothetical protein